MNRLLAALAFAAAVPSVGFGITQTTSSAPVVDDSTSATQLCTYPFPSALFILVSLCIITMSLS